jgi:LemA protein
MAEKEIVITVVAGFLILGLLIYVISIFNGLIRLKINIDKAWANIDVLLKKRHDLIPNLMAVVEGYKDFERDLITQVTRARSAAVGAGSVPEKARTNDALAALLGRLFAVAENYPKLKAQENFLSLQRSLSEIESEIADRRVFYNDSVTAFNIRIAQFPDFLIASPLGFQRRDVFKAAEGEKTVVNVGLSKP